MKTKEKEFNLSDKITTYRGWYVIQVPDVKEFIKLLKEEIERLGIQQAGIHRGYLKMFIDRLSGEKLK